MTEEQEPEVTEEIEEQEADDEMDFEENYL